MRSERRARLISIVNDLRKGLAPPAPEPKPKVKAKAKAKLAKPKKARKKRPSVLSEAERKQVLDLALKVDANGCRISYQKIAEALGVSTSLISRVCRAAGVKRLADTSRMVAAGLRRRARS